MQSAKCKHFNRLPHNIFVVKLNIKFDNHTRPSNFWPLYIILYIFIYLKYYFHTNFVLREMNFEIAEENLELLEVKLVRWTSELSQLSYLCNTFCCKNKIPSINTIKFQFRHNGLWVVLLLSTIMVSFCQSLYLWKLKKWTPCSVTCGEGIISSIHCSNVR